MMWSVIVCLSIIPSWVIYIQWPCDLFTFFANMCSHVHSALLAALCMHTLQFFDNVVTGDLFVMWLIQAMSRYQSLCQNPHLPLSCCLPCFPPLLTPTPPTFLDVSLSHFLSVTATCISFAFLFQMKWVGVFVWVLIALNDDCRFDSTWLSW